MSGKSVDGWREVERFSRDQGRLARALEKTLSEAGVSTRRLEADGGGQAVVFGLDDLRRVAAVGVSSDIGMSPDAGAPATVALVAGVGGADALRAAGATLAEAIHEPILVGTLDEPESTAPASSSGWEPSAAAAAVRLGLAGGERTIDLHVAAPPPGPDGQVPGFTPSRQKIREPRDGLRRRSEWFQGRRR